MSLKEMFSPESHVPLSLALKAGGWIFVSVQVPTLANGEIVSVIEDQRRACGRQDQISA